MKSEFYIAGQMFGVFEIIKVKGLIATITTVDGPLRIGFRNVRRGNEIICIGTELDSGVIIGKSNNIVNCVKEIRKNAKDPKIKLYRNSPTVKKARELIREKTESEDGQ